MAFTTEFVMGAGGAEVEEIPVSMNSGGGTSSNPTVYPLATVDAAAGALIVLVGTMVPASTSNTRWAHLRIGTVTIESPHEVFQEPHAGFVVEATGTVQIEVLSRYSGATTFTGTVYVVRL